MFYNDSILVREGIGYAIAYDKLGNTGPDSDMVFVPLSDVPVSDMKIIWKKNQVFTPAASLLLEALQEESGEKTVS